MKLIVGIILTVLIIVVIRKFAGNTGSDLSSDKTRFSLFKKRTRTNKPE